jgi:hypothetical protein
VRAFVRIAALFPNADDAEAVEVVASDLFHLQVCFSVRGCVCSWADGASAPPFVRARSRVHQPSEFLNDTVIDLYLKQMQQACATALC